ncbi:MAG: chaperone modulator CbpM [Candidatus Accumulibacter sp.]|jgi:chaperone modulatory protein CbpM|nr:chaperone modulator CbpM [Accumulibacter sp.]
MRDDDILIGTLLEEDGLTLDEIASACRVEPEWLARRLDEGLFPRAESVSGFWRVSGACVTRARRMYELERNFDAVPELAALVADLLEELDGLRRGM